jgi:hypothetical protein
MHLLNRAKVSISCNQLPQAVADGINDLVQREAPVGEPDLAGYRPVLRGTANSTGFDLLVVRRLSGRSEPRYFPKVSGRGYFMTTPEGCVLIAEVRSLGGTAAFAAALGCLLLVLVGWLGYATISGGDGPAAGSVVGALLAFLAGFGAWVSARIRISRDVDALLAAIRPLCR